VTLVNTFDSSDVSARLAELNLLPVGGAMPITPEVNVEVFDVFDFRRARKSL